MQGVTQHSFFETTIHEYFLDETVIANSRTELEKYAEDNKNASGISLYFSTYNRDLTTEVCGPYTSMINRLVTNHVTQLYQRRAVIDMSFFNYVQKGCTHSKHSHGDNNMVCAIVYYDDIGHTNFYDPRPQVFNFTPISIKAERGKVVLFPGWLEHEMPPHNTEGYRITMPFNFKMVTSEENKNVTEILSTLSNNS